jgi:aryl-alcohol dehydrogenase-like predicted oxidoreductase
LQTGVNVIDTASNYGHQDAERLVGQVLRLLHDRGDVRRDEVMVCSKAGYLAGPAEATRRRMVDERMCAASDIVGDSHCLAPAFIRDQILQSRANLGLETVDVYFLHNVEEQLSEFPRKDAYRRIARAISTLEEAAVEGWIDCYGFATAEGFRRSGPGFHLLDDLLGLALDVAGPDHHFRVVQVPINLLMTEAVFLQNQRVDGQPASLLDAAHWRGIDVIASAALGAGRKLPVPPVLRRVCPSSWTDAQISLQFVRSNASVCTALVGMTKVEHVEENLAIRLEPLIDLTAAGA